jgi:tetratricopeptide (TPR) repeat protein
MRRFRGIALMAIFVALAPLPDPPAQWQREPRRRFAVRQHTARVVGDTYAPPWFTTRNSDPNASPPPPLPEDPHDRGRALMRRGEISQAIPELRKAARGDDPAAVTDLAAALIEEGDVLPSHERVLSGADRPSRQAAVLDAIAMLHRAIAQQPGLGAAHFNLALALERVGLPVAAKKEFEEAIRLSDGIKWDTEAREDADSLPLHGELIERDGIQTYVEVTSSPVARRVLQPYLAAQEKRLRRVGHPVYPDSRFFLAADTYTNGINSVNGLVPALLTFCSGATAEPCITRYYTAGALYAAGRKGEAALWLHSVEDDVQRAHGSAGLRALQRWEEGLNMFARGRVLAALDLFETQYAEHRASHERVLAAVFDDLRRSIRVDLMSDALSRRDTETAFRYADGSSLRDVQSVLAPDAAILRYATAKYGNQIVFVIRKDSVDVVTLHDIYNRRAGDDVGFVPHGDSVDVLMDLPRDGVYQRAAEIAGVWTAARMRTAPDPMTASILHDLVVRPLLEKLEGISTIAVIPNSVLADIPFGALFDADRGQYLAERFTIVHARSARAAVALSKRTRDLRDSTLLAIGATEFDRTLGETLAGVDREIGEITAHSLCARVLSGEQATPYAIQRALGENTVIHYGGHIVHRGADLRLLLASSRGHDGLSAEEIAALRLDKARVVVLAGCGGAASGDPHAFIPTVADAFLMAGVPTVIATSYDLDDAQAPPTMRLLHTFLRNGDDAAEALRKTTLVELRARRGVPLSIRFQAVGGVSALVR